MAYPAHTLVTFGGTLNEEASDDEIWQCGVRGFFTGGGPVPADTLQELATNVLNGNGGSGGGLHGIWADTNSKMPPTAKLVWVKAANIGPDGTYTDEPAIAQQTPQPGIATATIPSFCCVAISWTTGKTLGKAIRGRIYPPNYGAALTAGATVSGASVTSILAWGGELLTVLANALNPAEFIPYVISQSGASNPITGVRVGNVFDTQRRRKDAVPEVYQSAAWSF